MKRRKPFTMRLEEYVQNKVSQQTLYYKKRIVTGRCHIEIIGPADNQFMYYRSQGSTDQIATDNLLRLLDADGFDGQIKEQI